MVNVRPFAKLKNNLLYLATTLIWKLHFYMNVSTERRIFFRYGAFSDLIIWGSKISIEQYVSNAYFPPYSSVNVFNDNIVQ